MAVATFEDIWQEKKEPTFADLPGFEEIWQPPKKAVFVEPESSIGIGLGPMWDVTGDTRTMRERLGYPPTPKPYTAPEGTPMRIGPAPKEKGYVKPAKPPGWEYASPIEKAVYAFDQSKVNSLLERFGKQFANAFARVGESIISSPFSPLGMNQEEINAFRPQAAKELYEDFGFTGSPPQAEILIRQRAADLAAAERIPKYPISPAEELEDKVVDVGAGLASFIAQLALLKKILPKGTPDPVIWEIQNQTTGGIPGQGAAMRLALGGIGGMPVGSLKGKLTKVGLESGLFAGVTAALGGDAVDMIISGLIPVTFNAWNFVKQQQHIITYERNLKNQALQKHYQRLKQGMNPATSRAYLKADKSVVENAVAKAKQLIYHDDAFAPAREKWELQRKKALAMIATGKPNSVKKGNAILDFLTKKPITRATTIEAEIKRIKAARKVVAKEKFEIPEKFKVPLVVEKAISLERKTQQFKEFALTGEGSGIVAAMSPGVAADIAAKEQPSRNDLKELGITGWNAEERKQLSSLFRDVLADQERMAYNQRLVEQAEEAVSWQQREAETALERETAAEARERDKIVPPAAEELEPAPGEEAEPAVAEKPAELDLEAMDQDELDMAAEVTEDEPDQAEFHEQLLAEQKRRKLAAGEIVTTVEKKKEEAAAEIEPTEPGGEEFEALRSELESATGETYSDEAVEAHVEAAGGWGKVEAPTKPTAKMAKEPSKKFYVYNGVDEGFAEVKGKLVKLDEFPELDLFLYKSGGRWVVSEGRTGGRISNPERTQKQAIESALEILTRNKDKIEETLQTSIEKAGLSPRWTEAAAPAVEKPKKKGLKEKPGEVPETILQKMNRLEYRSNVIGDMVEPTEKSGIKNIGPGKIQHVIEQDGRMKIKVEGYGAPHWYTEDFRFVEKEKPAPEAEQLLKLMNNVTALLQREEGAIDNRKVDEMAREVFGAAAGHARDAYDAFEAGMNKYIAENITITWETGFEELKKLEQLMPRQTRRDDTQVEFQQFSTPPTEAYIVAKAAAIVEGMMVLEPSAGTGNIAVLAREFGGEVEANEIDDRRRALLEALGFTTLNINAEQLDNLLDPRWMYDAIVMNPPFSATGGRIAAHSTKVGARHVEQALLRLKKGGRLVAIVGEGMALDRENFREWWAKIEKKYDVRANIGMSGKYYGKFGTTFGNQIVIIDNTGATESEDQIVTGADLSPTEALALLDSISRENVYERIKRASGAAAVQRKRKPGPTPTAGDLGPGVGEVPRDRGPGKGVTKIGKKRAPEAPGKPRGAKGVGRGVGGVGIGDVTKLTPQEQQELEETEKELRKELSGEEEVSYGVYPEEPVKKGRKGPGLNRKVLMLGIKHGALRAKSGVTSYADWSKLMTDAFGVRINPYLKKIYQSIRNKYPQYNLQSEQVIKEAGPDETVQVEKEAVAEGAEVKELEGGVFSEYRIQKATIKGAAKHPANIVESTVLASAEPPDVKVKHYLPSEVITEGRVSDIQMEAVVYAQQAHETVMQNGERAGIWIGDGTGLGKGREIYAVIYNNYMQGRRKAVHISVTHQLKEDAQRDSDDVGQPLKIIHQNPSMKDTAVIEADEGVLYTTYGMAAKDWKHSKNRYKQLIDWLGEDFDGVIAFDESHKMKNAAITERGGQLSTRGGTDVGEMGIDLQRRYPNARIMYVSATGGSEARHLVPYERLGLWGPRLPFSNFYEFAAAIQAGGIKAMETLARDLKLVGRFIARTISYEGVDFSQPVKYQLSDTERDQFDRMADFWAVLNQAFDEAHKNTNAPPKFTTYFATQQQFFLQLMMGYELPTVINEIEKDLEEGRSAIVSIVHTGESIAERIIADARKEGIPLEELELSPRQMLVDLVQRHFPLQQYEDRTDPRTGTVTKIPVLDAAGNPVLSRENMRIQEDLLSQIADFTLPTNPLDALIEHFGAENVAEITGRKHRMEHGKYVRRKLKGIKASRINEAETNNFQDGRKRIAVISAVGGQGISLHADLTKKNQQRRSFYAFELAWAADAEMQKFGRSHRAFQKSAPIIRSVSIDLAGQQRLINAISSRLAALGAITKGERTTLSGSLFTTNDLTDTYGQAALTQTYNEILRGLYQSEGIGPVVLRRMGILDAEGGVTAANMVNVNRFLNRIMSLTFKMQNRTFEIFYDHYQEIIARAKETGCFDIGIEDIRAKNIKIVGEPTVLYTHEESGAQTELFTLEGEVEIEKITFDQATRFASLGFYRNKASKHIYAAQVNDSPLATASNANRMRSVRGQVHTISTNDFNEKHEKVLGGEAKTWWDEEFAKTPATRPKTYHLLSGVIYPIYDKIMGRAGLRNKRMRRAKLADGSAIVGMDLTAPEVIQVKQRFGIGTAFADITPEAAMALMDDGAQFELDNGWVIRATQISGDTVLELVAKDPKLEGETIKSYGFRSEIIKFKKRFFELRWRSLPILKRVLAEHKIVRDITSREPPPGVSRGTVAETEAEEGEAVSYVYEPAETKAGGQLLGKLRKDAKRSGRKKVGLRSIMDYINNQLRVMMLVGKTQLSKKYPARYERGPHIIRTKSEVWQLNFHEAGHALSAMIEAEKPAWFAHISKMLLEMTGPGTMASAETPEEGLAELCRQYVINPGKIPAQIKQQFEKLLNELRPDLLAAFRDTHRAYTYHINRPYADLQQSLLYDMPKEGSAEQIENMLWDLGQAVCGDSMITHRLTGKIFDEISEVSWLEKKIDRAGVIGIIRSMIDKAYASQLKLAREVRKKITGGIANYDSARQSILRVPQEVEAAISGVRGKGKELNGITVLAVGEGFEVLSERELQALRDAGYTLPSVLNPGHGERIYIHPKSISDIKNDAAGRSKNVWEEFCAYGQGKAELSRWKTKRLQYPGMRTGLEPAKLERYIAQQEMEHPDWKEHFKAVNEYMDQLLLVPLLTGEKTVAEVIRIKKAWTDYWPLPRVIEGRPLRAGRKGADYSSGIKSAFGSSLPLQTLDKAVRMRTRMAFEAYAMHGFITSLINLGPELDKIKGLSFNAKKMINRIILPLQLDIKKIGQLTEHEEQQVIAYYLNKQAADLAGMTVKELEASGQGFKAEDVDVTRNHIDLWRMKGPNAIQVISKFVKGKRRYYQIPDPQIFKIAARGEDIGQFWRFFENMWAPWKKKFSGTVTQLWPFAVGNLALRDSGTAMVLGDQKNKATYLQGLYAAKGIINRITGKHEDVFGRSELLSKTLDELTKDSHRTKVESFCGLLAEGIVVKDWSGMTVLERFESLWGQALAVGLKPIDIANWLLGSRWAAQRGEEITREGAAIAMKESGASEARVLQAYETISGNFGQYGRSAHWASLMRMIPFMNAGFQVLGQEVERMTDPDPAVRARFFAVKLPYLAGCGAVMALGYIAYIMVRYPDPDDRKEIMRKERERPYSDRLGWINIFGLRLPYGYGIPGSLQSYGFNKVMEWWLEDPIPSDVKFKALFKRCNDIPGIGGFLPSLPKTYIELQMNHIFFFDDDIVPNWMLERYAEEPERQAWPNTPQLYKQIGSGLKISPLKIQHAVRSIFTSEMNALVRALDPRPYESKSEWPVIGRLITRPAEGYGSQAVHTVRDMESQWKLLRSKVKYQQETGKDKAKIEELQKGINKLIIAHQVFHEVTALWNDVKAQYEKPEPDYDIIKSRKRLMTERARKFIKWDMAGREGKFPAGIISDEYRMSLIKQRNMRPSPIREGEAIDVYKKRFQKVMDQKRNAAELLKLL